MLPRVALRPRKRVPSCSIPVSANAFRSQRMSAHAALDAGGMHAATQFALQDRGEEGAEDVAADGFVALVKDGPRLEQGLARPKTLLKNPNIYPPKG